MWKKKDVVYEKDMDIDLDAPGPADDFDLGLDQPAGIKVPLEENFPVFETRVFQNDPAVDEGPAIDEPPRPKVPKQRPSGGSIQARPRQPAPGVDADRIQQLEKRITRLELKVDHVVKLLRYIAAVYKKQPGKTK